MTDMPPHMVEFTEAMDRARAELDRRLKSIKPLKDSYEALMRGIYGDYDDQTEAVVDRYHEAHNAYLDERFGICPACGWAANHDTDDCASWVPRTEAEKISEPKALG